MPQPNIYPTLVECMTAFEQATKELAQVLSDLERACDGLSELRELLETMTDHDYQLNN